jgi:hypothetical protein
MTDPATSVYFHSSKNYPDGVFFVHMTRIFISDTRGVQEFKVIQMRHAPISQLSIVLTFHVDGYGRPILERTIEIIKQSASGQ